MISNQFDILPIEIEPESPIISGDTTPLPSAIRIREDLNDVSIIITEKVYKDNFGNSEYDIHKTCINGQFIDVALCSTSLYVERPVIKNSSCFCWCKCSRRSIINNGGICNCCTCDHANGYIDIEFWKKLEKSKRFDIIRKNQDDILANYADDDDIIIIKKWLNQNTNICELSANQAWKAYDNVKIDHMKVSLASAWIAVQQRKEMSM